MDFQFLADLWSMASQHKWLGVAVLVMGFIVRMLKSDTKLPISIPNRWLPLVVLVLSQGYAVLQMTAGGMKWKMALFEGIKVAVLTMGLFDVVVKAILNGKDMPPWLSWLLKEVEIPPTDGHKP